jgi:hypothetical protein
VHEIPDIPPELFGATYELTESIVPPDTTGIVDVSGAKESSRYLRIFSEL